MSAFIDNDSGALSVLPAPRFVRYYFVVRTSSDGRFYAARTYDGKKYAIASRFFATRKEAQEAVDKRRRL